MRLAQAGSAASRQSVGAELLGGGIAGGEGGKVAGQLIARELAIKALGGWEKIKAESDVVFATATDLALYLHLKHSTHPQYAEALQAMNVFYPGFDNAVLYASGRQWGRWLPVKRGLLTGAGALPTERRAATTR